MQSIKAGRPLVDIAKLCYRANLPLMLVGRHGVGKSELLRHAAQELGIDSIVYDLSLMEPTDLVGLPRQEGNRTVYCPPASLPTSGNGLLVIEEMNRAPSYMLAPCLQLLTCRRLNDFVLPKGWLPVASANPAEDGYDVAELDEALLSRFVKVEVEADREEWLAWAKANDVHPDVVAYVECDRSIFCAPESNPRAWTYVSELLLANGSSQTHLLQVAASGLVGEARAASFFRFMRKRLRPLKADEILSDYANYRPRIKEWVQAGKLELLEGSLFAVKTRLQSKINYEKVKKNRRSWNNLQEFLRDLPGDLTEDAARFLKARGYCMPARGGR